MWNSLTLVGSSTSCPTIRFSDRTGKSYQVTGSCPDTNTWRSKSASQGRRKRTTDSQPPRPVYWEGKVVTVWYDPSDPSRTLVAEQKPQFNPFYAINPLSLLFGTLTVSFWLGAKFSMEALRKPNGT